MNQDSGPARTHRRTAEQCRRRHLSDRQNDRLESPDDLLDHQAAVRPDRSVLVQLQHHDVNDAVVARASLDEIEVVRKNIA
jgi:hypothetical protein